MRVCLVGFWSTRHLDSGSDTLEVVRSNSLGGLTGPLPPPLEDLHRQQAFSQPCVGEQERGGGGFARVRTTGVWHVGRLSRFSRSLFAIRSDGCLAAAYQ